MTESCPRCGALVTFYASDIGESINCRSCNEPLKVTSDGLRAVGGKAAAAPARAAAPAPRRASLADSEPAESSSGGGGMFDAVGVLLGFLFLPGLFLTLLFLLAPSLDRAFAETYSAREIELNLPVTKAKQELERKKDEKREELRKKEKENQYKQNDLRDRRRDLDKRSNQLYSKPNPPQSEQDALRKESDELNKEEQAAYKEADKLREDRDKLEAGLGKQFREESDKIEQDEREVRKKKDQLELDRLTSSAGLIKRSAWYQGGLLIGVLILMVGSVGYLSSRQSMVRRVVGAIAIGAVVLLIAARMNSGRGVLLGMGGGGGGSGASAYNLSTPRDAYAALPDMFIDGNLHAVLAVQQFPDNRDIVQQMQEMKDTLKIHKEVPWQDYVILFTTHQERGKTLYNAEAMKFDRERGIWRHVVAFTSFHIEDSNKALADEVRHWRDQNFKKDGLEQPKGKIPGPDKDV